MKRLLLLLIALLAAPGCGNEWELVLLGGGVESEDPGGDLNPPTNSPEVLPGDDDDDDSPEGGGGEGDGCTLTQGYWKNHEESWPVSSLELGETTYSQSELVSLLRTEVAGDASMILAHQQIAALLNAANGAAVPAEIEQALDSADQWMAANADADGRLGYGVHAGDAQSQATALADLLADFNEGAIGNGHCE